MRRPRNDLYEVLFASVAVANIICLYPLFKKETE